MWEDGNIEPIPKSILDFTEGGIVDGLVPTKEGEKTQQNPDWLGDLEEPCAEKEWIAKSPRGEITQDEEMDRAVRGTREGEGYCDPEKYVPRCRLFCMTSDMRR